MGEFSIEIWCLRVKANALNQLKPKGVKQFKVLEEKYN